MIEQPRRILITGGAGFIGSNLCGAFLDEGYVVVCFDNLLTGKRENIRAFESHPNFQFIEGDIRDKEAVAEAMKGVEIVSHQAALGSVPRSIANPIPTSEINTQGFINVITTANELGIKRFIYASSSSVYGDASESPKVEQKIGNPLSPYAVSKLTNEVYGNLFYRLYGMETIGLRYFNVFGRNQDPNGVYAAAIPKFINLFLKGEAPTIFGNGEQTRDFTHISNVIEANKRAVNATRSDAFGESFNVACGASYTLNHVIDVIKSGLMEIGVDTSGISQKYIEPRPGDIPHSLANISKIQEMLNYSVQVNFEEGMHTYIKANFKMKKVNS